MKRLYTIAWVGVSLFGVGLGVGTLMSTVVAEPVLTVEATPGVPVSVAAQEALDAKQLLAKMSRIVIPDIELRQADIHDVVDFLSKAALYNDKDELDQSHKGVNIILNLGNTKQVPEITFTAKSISLLDAIKFVTKVADMKYVVENRVVMIVPQDYRKAEAATTPLSPLMARMSKIIIPSIEFREANVHDVVDFINKAARENTADRDASTRPVNLSLNLNPAVAGQTVAAPAEGRGAAESAHEITFALRYISLLDALKIITSVSGLTYAEQDGNVVLMPAAVPGPSAKTAPAAGPDEAVAKALRWLQAKQQADGSWPGKSEAMTGFALLTFLAHGDAPAAAEYGPTIDEAIQYLSAQQGTGQQFTAEVYANGIATLAMCEAFRQTKREVVGASAAKAIQAILDGQQEGGGFSYGYSKASRWDTSVAGWQLQALRAAKLAGIRNPGLDRGIEKAVAWLKAQSFNPETGMFSYCGEGSTVGDGKSWTMTGVGVLCLNLFGHGNDPEARAGFKALDAQQCRWAKSASDARNPARNAVYGWYYVTGAKCMLGGTNWDGWRRQYTSELLSAQCEDGHWEDGDWGGAAGAPDVYTTCLCALMLEAPQRYPPAG